MQEVGRISNTRCFDVEVFDDDQFDPSALVATTRSLVPLERLRDDLQEHLKDRKQELFDLINRDYADFILVSTKLSGVGAKVADLKDPMASLLERASGLRSSAEIEAAKLEAKLEERRGVRERKRSIQRCLRFMSTLETAEGVLGISDRGADRLEDEMDYVEVVGDGADGAVGGASGLSFLDVDEEDEGFDDPDLLEAFPGLAVAAAESESRPKRGPGLAHDGGGEGGGEGAREEEEELMVASKAEAECALLERAAHYALMMNADLQAAAEDEASGSGDPDATSLVRGLSSRASRVEAEITRRLRSEFASLLKPRQEWVFGTAMAAKSKTGMGEGGGAGVGGRAFKEKRRQALLSCLRPFSALGSGIEAEKQFARAIMQPFLDARFNQGALDGGERGSGRGLGPLLDELIAYVKEVAGDAVEFAEEMFAIPADLDRSRRTESGKKEGEGVGEDDTAPLPVDLVCNGVWRPLQQVLMTRLSAIFATGMVAAQRKNFALCMEFLERLAGVGGEEKRPRIRQRLLAQPCMAEFKSRWNLPIYFQLRSREISSRLEAALSAAGGGRPGDGSGSGGGVAEAEEEEAGYEGPAFEQQVFREAWRCLMQCWDDEVFLPCLAHRFLRLSLQGIARVGAWAGSAEVIALPVDDIVPVAASLGMLLRALKTDFVGVAAGRISSPAPGERHREGQGAMAPGDAEELVGEAVAEAAGELEPLVEKLWQEATSQVARQCKAILQAVKGITATYRMTNKPAPQRPSPFVPNVLRALREFDARWGASSASKGLQGSKGGDWKDGVVLAICARYLEIVSELLLTVRQMENTLNKRRVTARRGSRAGAADQGPSDKDKIMMQLRLDVHEFGKEAGRLGVDVSSFAPYEQLLVVVEAGRDGDGASGGVTSR